jgi:hypothetical protein
LADHWAEILRPELGQVNELYSSSGWVTLSFLSLG